MSRQALTRSLSAAIAGRQLVWVGTRGSDALALRSLDENFLGFTLLDGVASEGSFCLEDVTGVRVDLDGPVVVDERSVQMLAWAEQFSRVLERPSVLCAYRPTSLACSIALTRPQCLSLGRGHAHQAAFDYKPWVENELRRVGVSCLPWRYVRSADPGAGWEAWEPLLATGPVVIRPSRTTGGAGVVPVRTLSELHAWRSAAASEAEVPPDELTAIAPFLEGAVPLNVSAVVYDDGITLHPASVQLIGIASLTDRPFGYCGNDFAAACALGSDVLDRLQEQTMSVGWWLHRMGYRGAFGMDALLHEGRLWFTEVNPRFQGSTRASCGIAEAAGESCVVLEHVAACLGFAAPAAISLREWATAPAVAQLVVHRQGTMSPHQAGVDIACALEVAYPGAMGEVLSRVELHADVGATIARVIVDQQVTDGGLGLRPGADRALAGWFATATQS